MTKKIHSYLNRLPKAFVVMAAILAILGTVTVSRLYAQTAMATLSGNIVDPDGARVPGADITLSSATTKDTRVTVSSGEGVYHFAAVPPGTYTLVATHGDSRKRK